MADPQQPWEMNWGQTAADALGRPVIVPNPKPAPVQPKQIKGNYAVDLNTGTATPIAGLPADTGDQRDRKQVVNGNIVDLDTAKVTPLNLTQAAPDLATAREHVSDLLKTIDHATGLLDRPLTEGLAGSIFGHVPGTNAYVLRSLIGDPSDPQNPGQISGDLRQQGIAMLRALNGGNGVGTVARSQQEQAALQSAMSNLRQGLPADQLKDALGNVKQIYLRAYARSFGLDPDRQDVQGQFGIDPNYQLPGGNPAEPVTPAKPQSHDNGITESAPLPALVGSDPEAISTGEQAMVNPKIAAIAPQLTTYLNADPKKVSNAMIVGFMQKNGVDPSSTNIGQLLQMRATGKYKGFTVDPRVNVPLTGIKKTAAEVTGAVPAATAAVAGAADTASLGAVPDAAGIIHAVTGLGPTRSDVIQKRDALASAEPTATVLGNLAGAFVPLGGAGEASALARAGKTAAAGGAYGFLGSDKSDIQDRLFNGGLGALVAGAAHGATDAAGRLAQGGYRTVARPVEGLVNGQEATADRYALNAAARKMPTQNVSEVTTADAGAKAAGVPQPAAASINRGGQDYLARQANAYPAARAIVDSVAQKTRAAVPQQLADDFNSAIEAAAPKGTDTSSYLNRPAREIASDIQGMAGREFERGIAPIKGEKLAITPEVVSDLDHERVAGAIRDALANHSLSDDTRNELRTLIPQLKTLSNAPDIARQAYAKGIPLSVDSARNIATALDRTAGKLMDGSEGQVEMSRLSRDIRGAIADQFPEYGPVNDRYASRMRAKEAMYEARRNFMASTPDQQDQLAKASKRFTEEANPSEFGSEPQAGPNGFKKPAQPLPSNRQLAMTGAREAATVKAGENPAGTAERLATNINQRGNNATVLGKGADAVQNRAAVRANVTNTVDRIASASPNDKTETLFSLVRQAAITKATGGGGRYMLAHAAAALPGLSSDDAARVVRLYLDSDKGSDVLQSLSKAYGARRARFIMARMAAVTAAASGTRGFPQKPSQ